MKLKLVSFFICLFLCANSCYVFSNENEVEIFLFEVVESTFISGNDPLDSPSEPNNPPRPNQFRATISGRTLTVTSDNSNATRVVVRTLSSGTVVSDIQFVGYTATELSASGDYSIDIQNSSLTLVGQFSAQ